MAKAAMDQLHFCVLTALNNIQVAARSVKTNKLSILLVRLTAAAMGVQAATKAPSLAAVLPKDGLTRT